MAFTKTHLVLLIVSTTLVFAPTSNAVANRTPQAHVWMMCKSAKDQWLCYKTVLPKALDTPKFNIYKALEAAALATEAQVLKTAGIIATSKSNNTYIAGSLRICTGEYDAVVDSIKLGITAVSKRWPWKVRAQFSAVVSAITSCDDAFAEDNTIALFAEDAKMIND